MIPSSWLLLCSPGIMPLIRRTLIEAGRTAHPIATRFNSAVDLRPDAVVVDARQCKQSHLVLAGWLAAKGSLLVYVGGENAFSRLVGAVRGFRVSDADEFARYFGPGGAYVPVATAEDEVDWWQDLDPAEFPKF